MKYYKILTAIFVVIFVFICVQQMSQRSSSVDLANEQKYCRTLFPQSRSISRKYDNPTHYKIYSFDPQAKKTVLTAIAFRTTELTPEITGYTGPIDLMVGVNLSGAISGIHLISHSETQTYVSDLNDFLKQFISFDTSNAFQLGQDVDGISHATITSSAIMLSLQKGLSIIDTTVLSQVRTTKGPAVQGFLPGQWIVPLLLFSLALISFLFRKPALRKTTLFIRLIYLGIVILLAGLMAAIITQDIYLAPDAEDSDIRETTPPIKTKAPKKNPQSDKIGQRLKALGIQPKEALYWKEIKE